MGQQSIKMPLKLWADNFFDTNIFGLYSILYIFFTVLCLRATYKIETMFKMFGVQWNLSCCVTKSQNEKGP
jgi:hypothetical protein